MNRFFKASVTDINTGIRYNFHKFLCVRVTLLEVWKIFFVEVQLNWFYRDKIAKIKTSIEMQISDRDIRNYAKL